MPPAADDEVSVSSRSMKKWGIPENKRIPNEVTLLERLVWVKYKDDHWWPALLYQNYAELQKHLYDQLDMAMKAQFAMAIMKELQTKSKFRVARLLGRQVLEIVEVQDGQYAEFYWQLPNVLPYACQRSRYGNDSQLFVDFHRALDQVEEIIQEVSENKVHLLPSSDHKTWEQRARDALAADGSTAAPMNELRKPHVVQTFEAKEEASKSDDNGIFGGLDNLMATVSKGVDEWMTTEEQQSPAPTEKRDATTSSPSSKPRPATDRYSTVSYPRNDNNRKTVISSEPTMNHSDYYGSSTRAVFDESRDPSNEYYHRRGGGTNRAVPTTRETPKDRGEHDNKASRRHNGGSTNNRRASTVEILPGLEADDIFPGITETDVWKNVLEHMLVSKNNVEELEEEPVAVVKQQSKHKQLPSPQADSFPQAVIHSRMPSRDMQHREAATIPAVEDTPKINSPKFNPAAVQSDRSATASRPPLPKYTYKSTLLPSSTEQQARQQPESRGHEISDQGRSSDPDEVVAEAPPNRQHHGAQFNLESDDTLWGFLTCRATDF